MQIAGLILAGGASQRMGGLEKAFLTVGGVPMLARIARISASQCAPVVVSTTGDPQQLTALGFTVVTDNRRLGPMVGLANALNWFANEYPAVSHILSVPCDTPFLPGDLAVRLAAALNPDTFVACAASGGRLHPIIGLWPLAARHALYESVEHGILSFHGALEGKQISTVEWPALPYDPFLNINTPENLANAELIVRNIKFDL